MDLPGIRHAVDIALEEFLGRKADTAVDGHLPSEITELLHNFLFVGGKRLRPLLCVIGWYAAEGRGDLRPVIRAAASLEMFHAFALIHDDVMDRSATRRGQPTVHRQLAALHGDGRNHREGEHLGASAAVLVGDLALAWSDELLHTAGLSRDQLARVRPLVDSMRTEVMYGQYLDLLTTGLLTGNVVSALEVIRYKTAKYTVERPLHIGAALAGADATALAVCTAFALPLGEGFQLRDDLLGAFGKPETTGKSHSDDLREGKHTVLIALALRHADSDQHAALRALIGNPALTDDDAARIRGILTATGARDRVEHMIHTCLRQARHTLDTAPFPRAATDALRYIADAAATRTS
nr:polyprenyl synthetase family protein [Streptomyces boncukensis]